MLLLPPPPTPPSPPSPHSLLPRCPRGADCPGYNTSTRVHEEPVAIAGWYSLNVTGSECPEERRFTRPVCPKVVPCQPQEACLGANLCSRGYKSVAPILRCAVCDDCYRSHPGAPCTRFYRRSGEVRRCGVCGIGCMGGILQHSGARVL